MNTNDKLDVLIELFTEANKEEYDSTIDTMKQLLEFVRDGSKHTNDLTIYFKQLIEKERISNA